MRNGALTDRPRDRGLFTKGIGHNYYKGYATLKRLSQNVNIIENNRILL